MRAVIQRVTEASVEIDNNLFNKIENGYMILLGVGQNDTPDDIKWLAKKIANLRIFTDGNGKMNLNIQQVGGEILLISQFTLYADLTRGNRPGFSEAASPDFGDELYQEFSRELEEYGINVKMGVFGADMKISLINDGPVTIVYDTEQRK